MTQEEKIIEIFNTYNLEKEVDVWKMTRKNRDGSVKIIPLVTKTGIQKIVNKEKFTYALYPITATPDYGAVKCTLMDIDGNVVAESTGSAYSGNCKTDYYLEMAEKRSIGRAVLIAIDKHGVLYSEDEF